MKLKMMPLCLCFCLLSACSADNEPENIVPAESIQPATELPDSDPDASLPDDLVIPENAAFCQIEHTGLYDIYHFHDEHGNEILYMMDDEEDSQITTAYEYNSDGTIAVEKVKDFFGENVCRYTYNDDKTIKQCYLQTDGVDEGYIGYEYDKYGQMKKEFHIDTRGVCLYTNSYQNEYDSEGRLIRQKEKGLDALACDTQYEYDENGNVIHETVRSVLLHTVLIENINTYDAYGRMRTQEYHADDVVVNSEFEYIYF